MDADIYVLANNRKKDVIIKILDGYIPERRYHNLSKDRKYEFFDDTREVGNQPSTFFDTEYDLLFFLENQSGILFRPSFHSTTQSENRLIQLFYFEDDSLVIGLNIYQNSEREDFLLDELKSILGSVYGYIAYHIPPEHGKEAFIKKCNSLKSDLN